MTAKVPKPGEFAVVKYFETAFPEFKKHGLDLVATFTEFKVCDEKNGNAVFTCATVAGLDGFLRGLTYGSKK
jgi:hypothetical protein